MNKYDKKDITITIIWNIIILLIILIIDRSFGKIIVDIMIYNIFPVFMILLLYSCFLYDNEKIIKMIIINIIVIGIYFFITIIFNDIDTIQTMFDLLSLSITIPFIIYTLYNKIKKYYNKK